MEWQERRASRFVSISNALALVDADASLSVETYKPKVLEDRDVILKVTGSTICGSDLHLYHGEPCILTSGKLRN